MVAATLAALATVLLIATPGGAAPQPSPVQVMNTAANPVPVTQQGTASVNVANTPAASVPVREQNLGINGQIKLHEQGTANVRE